MPRIPLVDLAHARSGDKGNIANIGVIAYRAEHYELIEQVVTADAVKDHFGDAVGRVQRFELPNLNALNFMLHDALDGGGTVSLMNDAQGKVFSSVLLRMEVDVPEDVARTVQGRGWAPAGES